MPSVRLITIAVSHFCEKARWALDRANVDYVERRYLPLAHVLPVWLAGGGHMVPLLLDGKKSIPDSTAILKHIDNRLPEDRRLFPSDPAARTAVEELEESFDSQLGPATRRWAYFHLLPEKTVTMPVLRRAAGPLGRALLPVFFPLVRRLIRAGYRIHPGAGASSFRRIQTAFQRVDSLLADGRTYLAGDHFSAADLTFAALSVPVLFPDEGGASMPAVGDLPSEMARAVDAFRRTPAGAFALRIYREHRRSTPP
ncbi:MAG TPA: glutathione S-transferase family protein [Polyangia bacterium]|jgi:glutathione S-transferase